MQMFIWSFGVPRMRPSAGASEKSATATNCPLAQPPTIPTIIAPDQADLRSAPCKSGLGPNKMTFRGGVAPSRSAGPHRGLRRPTFILLGLPSGWPPFWMSALLQKRSPLPRQIGWGPSPSGMAPAPPPSAVRPKTLVPILAFAASVAPGPFLPGPNTADQCRRRKYF